MVVEAIQSPMGGTCKVNFTGLWGIAARFRYGGIGAGGHLEDGVEGRNGVV